MKKLVTLVLFSLISLTSLFADSLNKQSIVNSIKPIYLDSGMERGDAPVTGEIDDFEQGANGYGWYQGYNNKISYEPQTNTFASSYRLNHPSGSGTAGFSWGNFGEDTFEDGVVIYNPGQTGTLGMRYPFTFSKYGHHFSLSTEVFSATNNEDVNLYMTIMNSEGEFVNVDVIDPDGNSFPGWLVQADITYNETTGEYIVSMFSQKGLPKTDETHTYSVVTGRTTNLMDPDSWVFSDFNDLLFTAENGNPNPGTGAFLYARTVPKVAWGKNGFGVVFGFVYTGNNMQNTRAVPGYIYTTNYGEDWISDDGKFFTDQESFRNAFNWWGAPIEDDLVIDFLSSFSNTKIFIDENNKVNFIHVLRAGITGEEPGSFYPIVATPQGEPINGMYYSKADINVEDGSATYEHNYIATNAGWFSEAFGNYKTQIKFSAGWNISLGRTEDGSILYAGWSDRPILDENTSINPWLGNEGIYNNFIVDSYFTYSEDGGKTWSHSETPEGHDNVFYAHNISNTKDLNEESFNLTNLTHNLENGVLTVYSVWQEADLSQSIPLPNGPKNWCDHVQDYKMMKITVSNVESGIEEVTPTSISLEQNYPNPFNPTTSINYSLNSASKVNLTVFNAAGEMVTELVNGSEAAGNHSVSFDGSNLNSGVYFYKLTVNGISETKKMVLTK